MQDEADDPKYFTDGMFIKLFKVFPPGFDPIDCHPIQREFVIYLVALLPDIDGLQRHFNFTKELESIDKSDVKDHPREIVIDDTAHQLARLRRMNVVDYLRAELLPTVKRGRIKKCLDDWGVKIAPAWIRYKYGLDAEPKPVHQPPIVIKTEPPAPPSRFDILNLFGIKKNG